ncbi:alanine racemase [Paenibacillaceae bacterium WGS1546]|uniref:alanine racemase n=1 Tax=Cohnella sp. WGS1546 TaxID=3366810 RepID=UPI00372D722E
MKISEEELLQDTPFVAVDLDVMERNIRRMADLAGEAGVKLRPHTKTHKSPYIAQLQLDAGASGITTAKLGEAEVMAEAGIRDILVAFPLVGKAKLARYAKLLEKAEAMVALDDFAVAKGLNDVGEALKRRIAVYVDVDTGLHRMGRDPLASVEHILAISKLPFIEVRGLMSHTGHAYGLDDMNKVKAVGIEDAALMNKTKELLEARGVLVPEISVGATATARFIKEIPYASEMRPGMYVFNDRFVMDAGGAEEDDCALRVVATVVGNPDSSRIIIDAGSKTLALDAFRHGGHGKIVGHDNLTLKQLSEEHGKVEVSGMTSIEIGDTVQIIPNHVCPVVNLTDRLYGFRDGKLETVIPVAGRGKNR